VNAPAPSAEPSFAIHRVELASDDAAVRCDRVVLGGTATEAHETVRTLLAGRPPIDAVDDAPGKLLTVTIDTTEWPSWLMVRFGDGDEKPVPTADVADRILGMLTRHRLDEQSVVPRLHAAAVADSTGRTVLLLGDSGAGKSTLAAHLLASGLDLITDEQVAVHPDAATVSGFTRPIAVKPGGVEHLPPLVQPLSEHQGLTVLLAPEAFGSRHRLAGRPALVVVLDRVADSPTPPTVEPLEPTAAFRALAANNLDMVQVPVAACTGFAALAASVPTVSLRYSSSAEAASRVRELFDKPPSSPTVSWKVTPGPGQGAEGDGPSRSAQAITVRFDDIAVLFHRTNRSVVVLNEEATAVWMALPEIGRNPEVNRFLLELQEADLVTGLAAAEG